MLKPLNKRLNSAARMRRNERRAARALKIQVTQEKDRIPSVNNFDSYTKWALGQAVSPRKPDYDLSKSLPIEAFDPTKLGF